MEKIRDKIVFNKETVTDEEKKTVEEYIKDLLNRDFNVFDEQMLCDLLQIQESRYLWPELDTLIAELVEDNKSDVEQYKDYVANYISANKDKIVADENELQVFIKALEQIKLQTGHISKESVDFLIRQSLSKESPISKDTSKYQGLMERTIEEFGKYDVAGRVQKEFYCYFTSDIVNSNENTNGTCNGDYQLIVLRRGLIKDLIESKNLKVLNTVLHENVHAEQFYDINNSKSDNYMQYLVLKNRIMDLYLSGFYNGNYKRDFLEIDARQRAADRTLSLISKMEINLDEVTYDSTKGNEGITRRLNREILNAENDAVGGIQDKEHDGEIVNMYRQFDSIIQDNPKLIKMYPLLSMEYNEDGTKKDLNELLKMSDMPKDIGQTKLYMNYILASDNVRSMGIDEVLTTFAKFDCRENKDSETMIALLTRTYIKNLYSNTQKGLYSISPEELNNKIGEIQSLMQNGEFALNGSNAFNKGMNLSNGKNKSAKQLLNDINNQLLLKVEYNNLKYQDFKSIDSSDLVDSFNNAREIAKRVIDIEANAYKSKDEISIKMADEMVGRILTACDNEKWGVGNRAKTEIDAYRNEVLKDLLAEREKETTEKRKQEEMAKKEKEAELKRQKEELEKKQKQEVERKEARRIARQKRLQERFTQLEEEARVRAEQERLEKIAREEARQRERERQEQERQKQAERDTAVKKAIEEERSRRIAEEVRRDFAAAEIEYNKAMELSKQEAQKERLQNAKNTVVNDVNDGNVALKDFYSKMKSQERKDYELRDTLGIEQKQNGYKSASVGDVTHIIQLDNMLQKYNNVMENGVNPGDIESMREHFESASNIKAIAETCSKFLVSDYANALNDGLGKDFCKKVDDLIKQSQMQQLEQQLEEAKKEKVGFVGRILGKEKARQAQIQNLSLQKNLLALEKSDRIASTFEDGLADLYAYSQTSLSGKFTPEMQELVENVEQAKSKGLSIDDGKVQEMLQDKTNKSMQVTNPEQQYKGIRKYYHQEKDLSDENSFLQSQIQTARGKDKEEFFNRYRTGNNKEDMCIEFMKKELTAIKRNVEHINGDDDKTKAKDKTIDSQDMDM